MNEAVVNRCWIKGRITRLTDIPQPLKCCCVYNIMCNIFIYFNISVDRIFDFLYVQTITPNSRMALGSVNACISCKFIDQRK